MIARLYKQRLPLLEFALRIYIAYYFVDYGVAKLTGGMFNNATPEILSTPLSKVDLFHLTWYYFHKSTLLSYTVGVCQILSAILLLFNRTVLLGCVIALPILLNILLIDIQAFPDTALAIRIGLYMGCVLLFVAYRWPSVKAAMALLTTGVPAFKTRKWYYLLFIPLVLVIYLGLEMVICSLVGRVVH